MCDDIARVTEPIHVEPHEDGFIIRITSGQRVFQFHASRHKVANTNHVVGRLLTKLATEGCSIVGLSGELRAEH